MGKLKIFISWSGRRSQQVAEALDDWLPSVLQNVEPWLSTSDIEKGAKWAQAISGPLEKSDFGIICLTPENLTSSWLLFEAGSLAKKGQSLVWTYLYDVNDGDVKDPLSQFQHTLATEVGTKKLISTINEAMPTDASIPPERLEKQFERCWPELQKVLSGIQMPAAPPPPERNERDMISEILTRVRALESVLVTWENSDVADNLEALEAQFIERQLQGDLGVARDRLEALSARAHFLLSSGERGVEYENTQREIAKAQADVRALEAKIYSAAARRRQIQVSLRRMGLDKE